MHSEEIHILEKYGECRKKSYVIKSGKNTIDEFVRTDNTKLDSVAALFMTIFLPHGYPNSVSSDYLSYQVWDSIQAFASSISGGLCTHAILKGVGVGNESASAIAATITWLLKDGSYMIGKIGFAWLQGTKLDSDSKKWRLFADIINDAALLLDLLSGYFQNYFLPIVCTSGVLKAMVGVAGGSTRAALTQHQARKNNMADVSAKDGSQETLVNLLALLCNLAIIPIFSENYILTLFLFVLMTIIHLMANYFAVKSIVMETLNEERFKIYANHYFREGIEKRNYLSVTEVNKKENVLFFLPSSSASIRLGTSFADIIRNKMAEEVKNILKIYQNCDYILSFSRNSYKGSINIVFNKKATVHTHLESLFQACYVTYLLSCQPSLHKDDISSTSLEAKSREFTIKMFPDFMNSLKQMHFNTSFSAFNIDEWCVDW